MDSDKKKQNEPNLDWPQICLTSFGTNEYEKLWVFEDQKNEPNPNGRNQYSGVRSQKGKIENEPNPSTSSGQVSISPRTCPGVAHSRIDYG